MKRCARCGVEQPRAAFRVRVPAKGWLSSYCRPCDDTVKREWASLNRAREQARTIARRDENAERWRRWKAADPDRQRVMRAAEGRVRRAIKAGRLARPGVCQECGIAGRIEAAHADYAKPLEVRWLCRSCHVRWDHAISKR